jgi:hypothetical protein
MGLEDYHGRAVFGNSYIILTWAAVVEAVGINYIHFY